MPILPKTTKRSWIPTQKKVEFKQTNKNEEVYNTTRWRKLRAAIIQANPSCKVCESLEEVKEANVLDHIIPIKQGGAIWSKANFWPMCHQHQNRKSGMETNKGTLIDTKETDYGLIPKNRDEIDKLFLRLNKGG